MSEFTYLFRGRKTSGSPEEMQKHFEKWVAWFKDLGAAGRLKDPGRPLEGAGKVVSGSQKVIRDDLAQAVELSKGCPILEVGGSVEVRPVQKLNM